MHDLKYFEQNVNNRFGTSAAPAIDASLLPETASDVRLKWRKIPSSEVSFFDDGSNLAQDVTSALCQDGYVYLPVHPFEVDRWPGEEFVESGKISVSASYRTVFFEPDDGGILSAIAGRDSAVMMKLHLEHPLPGIDGDRRLTRRIVEKCVTLSPLLQAIMQEDPLGAGCEIVPEFLGMSNDETGVIFRRMPGHGVMPLFSLFSPDSELQDAESHMPGESALLDKVFFRDLEGVVFSNRYRVAQGLEQLFEGYDNTALVSNFRSMTRWFNRNVDHDLGRVFTASLDALVNCGYFGEHERASAVISIRRAMRQCVRESGVGRLNLPGLLLPISRSPYGSGLGKGHYYRTRYR